MKKKSGVQRSKLEATFRYLLLTFVAVTALIPAYIMFAGSFKTQGEFLSSPFGLPLSPSFSGYRAAWTDNFPNWLANSFLIVTGAVIVTEVLAALAAWGFARFPFKGRETILGIMVSLMVNINHNDRRISARDCLLSSVVLMSQRCKNCFRIL